MKNFPALKILSSRRQQRHEYEQKKENIFILLSLIGFRIILQSKVLSIFLLFIFTQK